MELWKEDSEDDTHEIEVNSVENKIKLLQEERYVINNNYELIIVYLFHVCVVLPIYCLCTKKLITRNNQH